MPKTPHKEKLLAAMANPKCKDDLPLLNEALRSYQEWVNKIGSLTTTGRQRIYDMTHLLNEYKDYLEVDLIARRGSPFIKRQKGQLKLDNTILEEFLIYLIASSILDRLPAFEIETGPQTAFMSLSFRPSSIHHLDQKPDVVLKLKDQDFTIGKTLYYQFSADSTFAESKTVQGSLFLAVLAAECKVNFDKTMFQECAGTASRLKQGCPISKYYALVEYLDMQPEDCRLTDIDNVFLLRHAKRLPFEKRSNYEEIKTQHKDFPIDGEVVFRFVQEIQAFIDAAWYDPDQALKRGSFV
ncbi:MAG: Bpu10I family restriction endonuclease [Chloroflexota bacterium]